MTIEEMCLFLDRLRSAQQQQAINHRIMEAYYLSLDDENERRRSMLNKPWAESKEKNAEMFRNIISALKTIVDDQYLGG